MRAFDRLPPPLRNWLADAALPWRPASVARAYGRALKRTGDPIRALEELDRLEAARLAQDRHPSPESHPAIRPPQVSSVPDILDGTRIAVRRSVSPSN